MPEIQLPPPTVNTSYGENLNDPNTASVNYDLGVYADGTKDNRAHGLEEGNPGNPESQLDAELRLTEEYKNSSMSNVLASNLDEIKRFAGIAIPKFMTGERLSNHEPADDYEVATKDIGNGFVELGSTGGSLGYGQLWLRPVVDALTAEQLGELDPIAKYNATDGRYGMAIAGELPAESRKLLDDLYKLIGAKLIYDDTESRAKIYQGTYHGSKIYLEERINMFPTMEANREGIPIHLASVLGEESAEKRMNMFTNEQVSQIMAAGLDPGKLYGIGVKKGTLGSYLESVKEIQSIDTSGVEKTE